MLQARPVTTLDQIDTSFEYLHESDSGMDSEIDALSKANVGWVFEPTSSTLTCPCTVKYWMLSSENFEQNPGLRISNNWSDWSDSEVFGGSMSTLSLDVIQASMRYTRVSWVFKVNLQEQQCLHPRMLIPRTGLRAARDSYELFRADFTRNQK